MAFPSRTATSIARFARLPFFVINDPDDLNPVFFLNAASQPPQALGINIAALLDSVGKLNTLNDIAGGVPTGDAFLDFSGQTLPASKNVLRGASLVPTRASGWTSFSGTVGATPAQVYTDYRELHSSGVAEVLGAGHFTFMDSGASCVSLFAGQFIAEVDAGATVLTAAGAPAVGVFPLWSKLLLNGETFNSGGVAAALFLSVQANVTNVAAEDVSMINAEIASGGIRSLFRFRHSAASGATNFFELDSEIAPVIAPTGYTDPNASAPEKALHIKIGSTEYMIPLYQKT